MAAPKDRAEKGERGLLRGIFSVSMGIQGSHFVSFSAPEGGLCRQWWMCVSTGDFLWVGQPDRVLRLLPGLWALYLQDSTHGTGQDLVHGEPRATSLQEAQVPHDSSRAQDALRVSASEETPHPGSPGPHCCPASPLGCLLRELLAKGSDAPSPPSAVTSQALP